jgi:hypothetical protein
MKRTVLRIAISLSALAALLVAHEVLLRVMADNQIVTKLLSPGGHTPTGELWTAGLFMAVRVTVVLLLPGILLSRIGLLLYDRFWKPVSPRSQ